MCVSIGGDIFLRSACKGIYVMFMHVHFINKNMLISVWKALKQDIRVFHQHRVCVWGGGLCTDFCVRVWLCGKQRLFFLLFPRKTKLINMSHSRNIIMISQEVHEHKALNQWPMTMAFCSVEMCCYAKKPCYVFIILCENVLFILDIITKKYQMFLNSSAFI